jgi:hypothetical protein
LSVARKAQGLFAVTAFAWEDIQSLLAQHPNVVEDFYPEHAYDIAGLLKALRELPSGDDLRELRDQIRHFNQAQGRPATDRRDNARWDSVSFAGQRDLGPALLGRPLGPADASACPRLQEVDLIIAQMRRAFSARLVGGPGSGKSVCAYQVAGEFASNGWKVFRVRDASGVSDPFPLPADDPVLLLIDDAHLMQRSALRRIDEVAGARRLVLSIHNGIEDGPLDHGAVVLDSKRAVRTIAAELLAHPEQTLAAVHRTDNDVGVNHFNEPLERRIDHAARNSDRPWQFCFILGGGWKRAKEAADAARIAGADLVLAAAAMIQVASRDAPLVPARLRDFCAQNGVPSEASSRAIPWLVSQRFLISETDCRCPHQRFAMVVLGRILDGQDENGRAAVGAMLTGVIRDADFPLAGLRIWLHELIFLGDYRRWTGLIGAEALEPLIVRCWNATGAEERTYAALMFSDLDDYVPDWFDRLQRDHIATIANWITGAVSPTAYGLSRLLNAIRQNNETTASEITNSVDAGAIARMLSHVTPSTAGHLAELIRTIGWSRTDAWKSCFNKAFNRDACVALAESWSSSEPLHEFASFCMAIGGWDDDLSLAMVEAFIPTARQAFADNPVSAFHQLDDVAGDVLRVSDPLGAYVGKLAPNRRRFALAKAMCAALRPKVLALQLSATPRRNFQDATFFLDFLKKASRAKFNATVTALDWSRIERTIGDDWADLPHDAEIFLSVNYSNKRARELVTEVVSRNRNRIVKFSPRVACMMPEVAIRHVESGRVVRLAQHFHYEFQFGAILVAQFAELRPDLVETLLAPFEQAGGTALSHENSSWFTDAAMFIEVIREAAPACLRRMLSAVDVQKAEAGWKDSLEKSGTARDAVALLIESALSREDTVGDMARKLRKNFPKRSQPKARKHRRREEDD